MDIENNFGAVCPGCVKYVNQMRSRYEEEIGSLQNELKCANEALDKSNLEINRLRSKQYELECEAVNVGADQMPIKLETNDCDNLSMREDAVDEINTEVEYEHPFDVCYVKTEPEWDISEPESATEAQQMCANSIESNEAHVFTEFECVVCKRTYETFGELEHHLNNFSRNWHVMNPNSVNFTDDLVILCHEPGCSIVLQSELHLTEHMWEHMKQPYACVNCKKLFPQYDLIVQSHETNCMQSEQTRKQNSVNAIFDALLTHDSLRGNNVSSKSAFDSEVHCEPCEVKTEPEDVFVIQLVDESGEEAEQISSEGMDSVELETQISNPLECAVCGQICETTEQLQHHSEYYSVKWYFSNLSRTNPIVEVGRTAFCHQPDCGYTFQTEAELKQHMRIHMKQSYNCPKCQRAFHQYDMSVYKHEENCKKQTSLEAIFNALLMHERLKTLTNPSPTQHKHQETPGYQRIRKVLKCEAPGCWKSYVRKRGLRRHLILAHPNFKGLTCDEPGCGETFLSATSLITHKAKTRHCLPRPTFNNNAIRNTYSNAKATYNPR